jgi:hypothetical protein
MANILGYNRTKDTKRLISSDFAAISLDSSAELGLVQQASAQYSHQVIPRFEAGSSNLFWVTGQSQGTVTLGRAVSQDGFFGSLRPQDAAGGTLVKLNINMKNANLQNQVKTGAGKSIHFTGGIIAAMSSQISAASLDVSESVTINCAEMFLA